MRVAQTSETPLAAGAPLIEIGDTRSTPSAGNLVNAARELGRSAPAVDFHRAADRRQQRVCGQQLGHDLEAASTGERGLQAGDAVIVYPSAGVDDGVRVQVRAR